jgi:hypothetical protein
MKKKLVMAFVMILGSFSIYCVQSTMQGQQPGSDAHAQSNTSGTCTPPPRSFVVLGEGDTVGGCAGNDGYTIPISVAGYAEVVVYVTNLTTNLYAQFRATPSATFGSTGEFVDDGGRLQVNGSDMRLHYDCAATPTHWVIAGVQ